MADRTSPGAQRRAFSDLSVAIGEYLETLDWHALVVGPARIQQQPFARALQFELVVQFTGHGPRKPTRRGLPAATRRRTSRVGGKGVE